MKVKIVDRVFSHCGFSSDNQKSKFIEWDRTPVNLADSPVFYTDLSLDQVNSSVKKKIAWLIEPMGYLPQIYNYVIANANRYDKILTHEKTLVDRGLPFSFVPFGGCWINTTDQKIYDKSKNISMIASNKRLTNGHILRHNVINNFRKNIDLYGRGFNPISSKLEGLRDYRFSIAIENCKRDFWFTEKLIDCFMTGTVPIYWGCPSISNFFDKNGIIVFNDIKEIPHILEVLTAESYNEMKTAIENNFKLAQNYILAEDWIYTNLIAKGLL